jgi:hypothetical protein
MIQSFRAPQVRHRLAQCVSAGISDSKKSQAPEVRPSFFCRPTFHHKYQQYKRLSS